MPKFTRGRGKGRGGFWSQWKKRGNSGRGLTSGSSGPSVAAIPSCTNHRVQDDSPYRGWKYYYPEEKFAINSTLIKKVKLFEEFFLKNKQHYSSVEIEEKRAFCVDLNNLCNDEHFMDQWNDFLKELTDYPERTLGGMALAMHQVISNELQENTEGHEVTILPVRARPLNFEPIIQLKTLKANYHGKLVSLKGTVIRVGSIKLLCTWLAFACNSCGYVQSVRQTDGVNKHPSLCSGLNCRSRTFSPLCTSMFTQTQNWQTVRLQEHVADDQREGGRVPRTVECELMDDLVDTCGPGDVVTITGIVKVRNTEDNKKKGPSMFLIYIFAVSIVNSKTNSVGGRNTGNMTIEFNLKDYYAIKEIHSEPSVFRLLVNSLCPAVYGHEMVKAGLLLALFGGASGTSRGDIHILVVGDPGLGKSHMLQSCSTVAPRGVYVCGNTSTASGLTVTLTREGGSDYALEAGALVLANQGCCCIDEFDKMSTQHQALLEAMEQQCISIAKAGVVCSLPARTSILAAANPAGGHYNSAKTVSENLRMGQALLSRFDLVFILLDKPNEHLDSLLSEHIMALHSNFKPSSQSSLTNCANDKPSKDTEVPLSERLKLNPGEYLDAVPQVLLRKYIAYARKYVPSPVLSAGAARILQHFYLELRKQHHSRDSTPITTRQLESLIRLTQARAKLELREEATEYDALDVVELLRWSMVETFSNELGVLDFQRSQNGSGMSTTSQAKKFINGLQRRAELQSKSVFSGSELKEVAASLQLNIPDFHSFISTLNLQGFLIKKGKQLYQLLTVDY